MPNLLGIGQYLDLIFYVNIVTYLYILERHFLLINQNNIVISIQGAHTLTVVSALRILVVLNS